MRSAGTACPPVVRGLVVRNAASSVGVAPHCVGAVRVKAENESTGTIQHDLVSLFRVAGTYRLEPNG
jgi:hypothetical protein